MLRAWLLLALFGAAVSDIATLKVVSAKIAQEGETEAALAASVKELTRAEQACSADADGKAEGKLIASVREGYEKLLELFQSKPVDLDKVAKKLAAARKKQGEAQAVANDDEELVSKAEKAERAAALEKANNLVAKLEAQQKLGQDAAAVRQPRKDVLFPRLAQIRARMGVPAEASVQVLSEAPMVVIVDDWLGEYTTTALKQLPLALERALKPPAEAPEGGEPPKELPTNASMLVADPSAYSQMDPGQPTLCLPMEGGAIAPAYAAALATSVSTHKAKAKAGDPSACLATAGITDDQPPEWDTEDDGEWQGEFNLPTDRYTSGCGPLTPALESDFVQTDSAFFTASAEAAVDICDFAVSSALGVFPMATEAMAQGILQGLEARPDTSATKPDTWDDDEDGEWAPPLIDAKTPIDLLASYVTAPDVNASSLGDAYSFSSSPELVRFRGAARGGDPLHHLCSDFSRGALATEGTPSAAPALVAFLHASEPAPGSGGELVVPAAGVSVSPQFGRLVLVETTLPAGTCDPAAAMAVSPLEPSASDLLMLRKTFYADRSWSRERGNKEGPRRGTPQVLCGEPFYSGGCRRFEYVPADKGEAVLPLRASNQKRECMAPGAHGACFDASYVPPPPAPKKSKKKPAEAAATPAAAATPSPPATPQGPRAPPPVNS